MSRPIAAQNLVLDNGLLAHHHLLGPHSRLVQLRGHPRELFTGVPPSSLDHGVIRGMTMRLYLLTLHHQVLCIELDDIDKAPSNLVALSRVVRRLWFGT